MKEHKEWIGSAEITSTKWEDGETRWTWKIVILSSDPERGSQTIVSRVFDEYSDCVELMNDKIQMIFIHNTESGFPFNEKEAEKRFNKETYTKKTANVFTGEVA